MEEKGDRGREGESIALTADFKSYKDRVTSSLLSATRQVNALSAQDLSFHRNSSDNVSRALDRQNSHLLRLTNKLLKAATADSGIKAPLIKDQDGIDDNWSGIVDVIDDLLEKADASLDEFTGLIKRQSPSVPNRVHTPPRQSLPGMRFPQTPIEKPQLLFNRKVNNFETEPWKPLLTTKPHATVPLNESIGSPESGYQHPYRKEIEEYQYPQEVYQEAEPIEFWPPEQAPAVFVETEHGIHQMLQELKSAKEIAVDLEHHDYHTYTGVVCLMQISTRSKDWIIDTLKPWRENLQILNQVFADPSILKIFHGSAMDMIWLQRDLGLYVVGLFDTYYASDALNFPGKSLRYLLQEFANFEAQKQFQLADWRRRPLIPALIEYARSDTHYLLYIYDQVRNLLVQNSTPDNNLIDYVLKNSKKEALQTYERFVYNMESGRGSGGWFNMIVDRQCNFSPQQFAVYRAVHQWRDAKARELDESPTFVMKAQALWSISESMPTNMTSLYATRPVPDILHTKQVAEELFQLIREAKDASKDDPLLHRAIQDNEAKYGARPQNRWRKVSRPDPNKNQLTGLAATLKQLQENGDVSSAAPSPARTSEDGASDTQAQASRAQQSSFWGGVSTSSPFINFDPSIALAALQTIRPLPLVSAESFTNGHTFGTARVPAVSAPPTPVAEIITPAPNSVFTLQDRSQESRKRKAEEEPQIDNADTNTDSTPVTPTSYSVPGQGSAAVSAERLLAKEQRKAEKRARKAAKLEAQEQQARDMVPFDYDAAESMLEPKQATNGDVTSGKGRTKAMNPFAKALDTGTGARRNKLGQEGAGRSMTFKS